VHALLIAIVGAAIDFSLTALCLLRCRRLLSARVQAFLGFPLKFMLHLISSPINSSKINEIPSRERLAQKRQSNSTAEKGIAIVSWHFMLARIPIMIIVRKICFLCS